MNEHKIPKATAKRLPLYHRYLQIFLDSGKTRVSSQELSEVVKVDSATIRRDFSYFGELGKRGYGYDVESLLNFFARTLSEDQLTQVALVGVGNLGNALLKYRFHQSNSIRISAAFDVQPELTNKILDGIPVYDFSQLEEQIKLQGIEIAILTVPAEAAQTVAERLVEAGVKGIMNFTPARLSLPSNILVQNVDLTNELQTLIYFLRNY